MAIEHPKDVDLAAGIVLAEVIPFMSKRPTPPSIPPYDKGHGAVINIDGTFTYLLYMCVFYDSLC